MPTENAVRDAFDTFVVLGLQGGPGPEQADAMVKVWTRALGRMTDADLDVRLYQWIQRNTSRWWPVPGEFMHLPGDGTGPVILTEEQRKRIARKADEIAAELWLEVVVPESRHASARLEKPAERYVEDEDEEIAVRAGIAACGGLRVLGDREVGSYDEGGLRRTFCAAAADHMRQALKRPVRGVVEGGKREA